jgi:hypothetical protein
VSVTDAHFVRPKPLALHESSAVLIVLALAAMIYVWEMNTGLGIFPGFADIFMYSIQDPVLLLHIAFCTLSLQLVWLRWRRRDEPIAWRLSSLDRKAYFCNWLACAALVTIAIPTTAAFCFLFWLGPWYLYGP